VEDEALIDREDIGVRDSQIELHKSMTNLCESNMCLVTITRQMQKYTHVKVPCGNLATVYNKRHHQEERQTLSSRAAARWYKSTPGHRNANNRDADYRNANANDGRMYGTELSSAANVFACSTISMVMRSYDFLYLLICAVHDEAYQGPCRTNWSPGLVATALSTHIKKPGRIPTYSTDSNHDTVMVAAHATCA
jgi:hypothetical protein